MFTIVLSIARFGMQCESIPYCIGIKERYFLPIECTIFYKARCLVGIILHLLRSQGQNTRRDQLQNKTSDLIPHYVFFFQKC
jgi:hypothetical protein